MLRWTGRSRWDPVAHLGGHSTASAFRTQFLKEKTVGAIRNLLRFGELALAALPYRFRCSGALVRFSDTLGTWCSGWLPELGQHILREQAPLPPSLGGAARHSGGTVMFHVARWWVTSRRSSPRLGTRAGVSLGKLGAGQ